MQRQDVDRLSREQLIDEAERLGVPRPRTLTQAELVDEILGRTTKGASERARVRGWLGRARDLLARVVERGLHLPEAARALRRESEEKGWPTPPPPLPTVTLAEIYAAQGHIERALAVLDEVLGREADHKEARAMRARLSEQAQRSRLRTGRDSAPPPIATETPGAVSSTMKEAEKNPEPSTSSKTSVVEKNAISSEPVAQDAAPVAVPPSTAAGASRESAAETSREEPSMVEDASDVSDVSRASHAPLEDPPLPDRYEVDEVVAIAVDPRTVYLYWEVRPTTLARARAGRADGRLAVRVATVIASWEGPVVETQDLPIDALYGDRFVRDVKPGSNVRVSVGWLAGGSFEPFAVGAEVIAPRATPVESVAQEIARWEASPAVAAFTRPGVDEASREEARVEVPAPPAAIQWPPRPPRASEVSTGRPAGAPVDTGVTHWTGSIDGGSNVEETEEVVGDEIVAIGSSDLARRPRVSRVSRITHFTTGSPPPGRAYPGASELSR